MCLFTFAWVCAIRWDPRNHLAPGAPRGQAGTLYGFSDVFNQVYAVDTATGAATLIGSLPANSNVWFQFVIPDLSTNRGLTLSNGLRATTQ